MKRFFSFILFICVFHCISKAQVFIDAFLPDSPFYEGHCSNPNHQLDTLYWTEWHDNYSPGGALIHTLGQERYDFTYLPDGHIYQIMYYGFSIYHNQWVQGKRYSFEYDENGRLTTFIIEQQRPNGQWQYYTIKEYSYDIQNRVTVVYITGWNGDGYEDSHQEDRFEYDAVGHCISKSVFLNNLDIYFCRWLYTYENDKMTSECYQRWGNSTWNNWDLFIYSYENDNLSNKLYQIWNYTEEDWDNYENNSYEYRPEEGKVFIISQSWNNEWINRYRATNFISNGRLVIESTQEWQDGEWVDFSMCDYSFDGSGNFIEARWKDYVDGEWVDSDYNIETTISYNNGASILSGYIQSFQARYSCTDNVIESSFPHQAEVFPNPGSNQFTIQTETPFSNVIVYDLMGRQVFSQVVSGSTIRINTDNWPSGVYFWKAYDSNSAQSGKWVKN